MTSPYDLRQAHRPGRRCRAANAPGLNPTTP